MSGAGSIEFEEWYREIHPRLVTTVAASIGDAELAREAVDEALARAFERWERVRVMVSPAGWTYRVALNAARRRARRRTFEVRVLRQSRPEVVPGPTLDLRLLVVDLPPCQRDAVLLRHVAQMTEAEIAEVMGVARGTVSSSLRAAYRSLSQTLDDESTETQT